MASVEEFGRGLTSPLGAPRGKTETYIEVPFLLGDKKVIPDGLVQASRGKRSWTALVEVKTGDNELQTQQLENYLDVAKANGFDALITISNQIAPATGVHPTRVDRRKLNKVALHHWSWSEVLTQAVLQQRFKGVSDPDQAWILGELIRYLEHPRSGALSFHDMGASWVAVREAVGSGTLRKNDKGVPEVTGRFDALMSFACLRLGRSLGVEVKPELSRAEVKDPKLRTSNLVDHLVADGCLAGSIRVPDLIAPIYVRANLKSGQLMCSIDVEAPTTGRSVTRVNWLLRQLKEASDGIRIESFAARAREGAAELLGAVREDPTKLVPDAGKEIVRFRVARLSAVGSKRGLGRNSFIDSVTHGIDDFYEGVAQRLKAFVPPSPKYREPNVAEATPKDVAASTAETSSGAEISDMSTVAVAGRVPDAPST